MIVSPECEVRCGSCDRIVIQKARESKASIGHAEFLYCHNCYDIVAIEIVGDGSYKVSTIDGDET